MQLIICGVFLFATAMCMNNVSHSHQLKPGVSTEQGKEDFFNNPVQNSTELNQETTSVTHNVINPQQSTESKNEVPMIDNGMPIRTENMTEAVEPTVLSRNQNTEMKSENNITTDIKEKNEVPVVNHNENQYDPTNNQTTDKGAMENNQLQVETSPTPAFSCSLMWPECTNPLNAFEDVSRELTRFTLELYKILSSHDKKSNIVISPLSIALGLSQLMLGSSGKTREDMLKIMYGGIQDPECVHHAIKNLTKYNSFLIANEIFFSKDISLKEEFTKQSERFYGAKGKQLKNNKTKNLSLINNWVSSKTNGLITKMFKELPDFQLMLINVIHYQGKWMNRFNPSLTKKDAFQTISLSTVRVPMMNNDKYPLQSIRDTHLEAHVGRLPLSDNCSLIIFLPFSHEKDALKNVESHLTEENVNLLMTQLEEKSPRATSVSFPKLKLKSDFGLTETLRLLGLYELFENPDFCALSDSTELAISDVHHHAVLEINEDGAKAVAATSVTVARTMSLFSVQKPFLYILVNDKNKIPIVIGRVTDPSK